MATYTCEKCGKLMLERTVKKPGKNYGKKFLGCSGFPACNNMVWNIPREEIVIERKENPTNVTGTPQQDAFWYAIAHDTKHIILSARAGTGKTFSIVHALTFIPKNMRVLFAAFNTIIVNELKTRVDPSIMVRTMNSFGNAQVKAWMPKLRFNEFKLSDMLEQMIPLPDMADNEEKARVMFLRESVTQLVNFSRYNMVTVNAGTYDHFDYLADAYDIQLNDSRNEIYTYAKNILKLFGDIKTLNKFGYDYIDQTYLIWRFNIPVESLDILFGDEIQDWNKIQWHMAYKAVENNGRFIGVGDPYQSIYGFAGADIDSMNNIESFLQNTNRGVIVLPLTYTRRCPVSHVNLAKTIISDFESMDGAIDGTIKYDKLDNVLQSMPCGSMGLSRRNAPLIAIAYQLIRQGKAVIVRGRDIAKNMQGLISKLKANTIIELIEKAEKYRTKELDKLTSNPTRNENKIQALNDRIDTLIALTEGKETIDELRRYIQQLFDDVKPQDAIYLSSVHRAKGLESDTVYVFDYAKIELKLKNERLLQQEKHLHYIALTRSKDTLYLVD